MVGIRFFDDFDKAKAYAEENGLKVLTAKGEVVNFD